MIGILRYNWRFYAATAVCAAMALSGAVWLPTPWRILIFAAVTPAVAWVCSSLLVSYYVYDRSPLYSLEWLNGCLSRTPARWVNIHAGLDETSRRLTAIFPSPEPCVLDIYDPREMTEPSIAEARSTQALRSTPADWRALPLQDGSVDTAFVIFAAHELRRPPAREQFFGEVHRILSKGGEMVLVEHLRDWANFLAFGPGFLHFFGKRAWVRAAAASGLEVRTQTTVTPFVNVFVMRKAL